MTSTRKEVAAALGLTERRVRQLIASQILPEEGTDGGFDLPICETRYDLYHDGSAAEWAEFLDGLERDAKATEKLGQKALRTEATLADVQAASRALQRVFSATRFALAANPREKSADVRAMMLRLVDYDERAAFAPLIAQGLLLHTGRSGPWIRVGDDYVPVSEAAARK